MGTPYFKSGAYLGDRPIITDGVAYTTGSMRYGDNLTATNFKRSGATPFTGAFKHDTQLTEGYCDDKQFYFEQAEERDDYASGARSSTISRGVRQIIDLSFKMLTAAEAQMCNRFFSMYFDPEGDRVVELVDEHGNEIPVRIDDWKTPHSRPESAHPYDMTVKCSHELTSEEYTHRTGGQTTY